MSGDYSSENGFAKAGCVLKNEKSEKKDPEAFIRNNQDKMHFGSFSYIYIHYIILLYVCRDIIAKTDLRN